MNNGTVIHVAAEVLIIGGVFVYFNKKVNALNQEIEALKKDLHSLREANDRLGRNIANIYSIIDVTQQPSEKTGRQDANRSNVRAEDPSLRQRKVNIVRKKMDVTPQEVGSTFDDFLNMSEAPSNSFQDMIQHQMQQILIGAPNPMLARMFKSENPAPKVEIVDMPFEDEEPNPDEFKEELAELNELPNKKNEESVEIYDIKTE
jgi:hypothetical protein